MATLGRTLFRVGDLVSLKRRGESCSVPLAPMQTNVLHAFGQHRVSLCAGSVSVLTRLLYRGARSRRGFTFLPGVAAVALLILPFVSFAQPYCARLAAQYDALQTYKQMTTPERVADVYVETFTTKAADRDAQAVWRRMQKNGVGPEEAAETHLARYYSKRPPEARSAIKARIIEQVRVMSRIHELVLAFESVSITNEFAAQTMGEMWRWSTWVAPYSVEHYVALIRSASGGQSGSALDEEQAAVRAAVDARSAVDRDSGAPPSAIETSSDPCYKDALTLMEIRLRSQALPQDAGQLADSKAAGVAADMSPLTYYTHQKFGPRDYSLDRLEAWRIAAESSTASR